MKRLEKIAPLLLASLLLAGCAGVEPEPEREEAASPVEEQQQEPAPEPAPELVPEPENEAFVRVRDYIPKITVDLRYATADNFTGQVIYTFSDAYLRYGTVKKLAPAQETLAEQG